VDLLCRCTGHAAKRRKDETQQQFLARITHLYCSGKGLEIIENLHLCRSLIALYLYDNKISKIDDINGHTPLLTHLYLQHNRITRMENLNNLHRLTKLYLSYNSISVVEGLEELTQLTELHIASQNLPKGEKLHFDPRTLKTLSNCLIVLNISGNQLDTLDDIAVLAELQQLIANDNKLSSMRDIAKVLSRLLKLWKLDLYNNPIALKQKYRDRIVTMCHRLGSQHYYQLAKIS
jgi:protein phosphatase 1 regulatory subunit 42